MELVTNMGNDLVSLRSGTEPIPSNLERWDCSNAHRTLGMWPALNGSAKKQYEGSFSEEQTIFPRSSQSTDVTLRSHHRYYWTMYIVPSITFGIGSTLMDLDDARHPSKDGIQLQDLSPCGIPTKKEQEA